MRGPLRRTDVRWDRDVSDAYWTMTLTLRGQRGRVQGSARFVVTDHMGKEKVIELEDPREVPGRFATPTEVLHGFFRLIAIIVTESVNEYIVWKALYSVRKKR